MVAAVHLEMSWNSFMRSSRRAGSALVRCCARLVADNLSRHPIALRGGIGGHLVLMILVERVGGTLK